MVSPNISPLPSPAFWAHESSGSPCLVSTFPTLSHDPNNKCSITIVILKETNLLSKPLGVANFIKSYVTTKERMDAVSSECLLNESMHAKARANALSLEGLLMLIVEKTELIVECDSLLGRIPSLEAKLFRIDAKLDQKEQGKEVSSQEVGQLHVELV